MSDVIVGGFYVDTLELTSIEPGEVEDHGGHLLAITGKFANSSIEIAVVIGAVEYPCYSGQSGYGYAPRPVSGTLLNVVTPPLPKGGPYDLVARQGIFEDTLAGVLTVRNRFFRSRVTALRQLMPPILRAGPRSLDVTDPLA
jgi:hypothetical protein